MNRHTCNSIVLAALAMAGSLQTLAEPAPAAEPEKKPRWESSLALGFTLTKGNSDTLLFTGSLGTQKRMPKDEWAFGIDGAYGEDNSVKNNEILHAFGQYNRLFTERFFGYARVDGLHDGIADLDYRFTISPGVGYYFIKEKMTTLAGEIGPGYVFEKKGGETDNYFTIRLAERFEHKFSDRARVWESVEYLPDVSDWSRYVVNAEVGAETALVKQISLWIKFQDTYDSDPAPGRESNDLKLVSGVSYKF